MPIEKNTVFVLGAGASKPFGLPTAAELREHICAHPTVPLPPGVADTPRNHEQLALRVKPVAESFKRSGQESIDSFLEHRPEFELIGKQLIAEKLGKGEMRSVREDLLSRDWYQWLFKRMFAGSDTFSMNNVSFVTFNYDRTLELALFQMLFHSTPNARTESVEATIANLRCVHVYGRLGNNAKFEHDGRWHLDTSDSGIGEAALSIKIMSDERSNDQELRTARSFISSAERLVFLGFGFDRLNCERLGMIADDVDWIIKRTQCEIFASAMGMFTAEAGRVRDLLGDMATIGDASQDCLTFLRDSLDL